MVIFFYNFLMLIGILLASPFWIPLAVIREKRRRTVGKRLYLQAAATDEARARPAGPIWIHALSVGEVQSAEPLVRALAKRHGQPALVFTASTLTGFQTALRVIAPHVGEVRYFPYDLRFSVDRALDFIAPRRVIVVETDIWPNFLDALKRRGIPAFLVNARLSARSFRGYKRAKSLMAPSLAVFDRVCVQTLADRKRFYELGVAEARLITVGNIKFDQPQVDANRETADRTVSDLQSLLARLPIWLAGSTHEGEEAMLIDVCHRLRRAGIETVLIVVPRDPARASKVCDLFHAAGIEAKSLGRIQRDGRAPTVVVVDRIGILRRLYRLAHVTFVGGSLVRAGGHNPLEPASVSKPILFGPHTEDFHWICQTLVRAGGAVRVGGAAQLARQVARLMTDGNANRTMGRRAYDVFHSNRGAVARTMAVIDGPMGDDRRRGAA